MVRIVQEADVRERAPAVAVTVSAMFQRSCANTAPTLRSSRRASPSVGSSGRTKRVP
jgi:hypothetical protein